MIDFCCFTQNVMQEKQKLLYIFLLRKEGDVGRVKPMFKQIMLQILAFWKQCLNNVFWAEMS